jgi:ABC-type transport system involved in multi-copper enzyme maturation permease subunit
LGNWLTFFVLGFLSVLSITNEFSNRTLRQNIINGLSRTDFFLAKLIYIISLSLTTTIIYAFFAFVIGWFHTENIFFSRITEGVEWIGRYFLMCLSFSTMGLFLGALFRKSGLSLFLFLIWTFFLEKILRYGIHYKFVKNETMHYYPMNATNDLIPPPVPKMLGQMMENNAFKLYLASQTAVIVVAVYIALFLAATYFLLKNKDL